MQQARAGSPEPRGDAHGQKLCVVGRQRGDGARAGFKPGEGETAVVTPLAASADPCLCPGTVGSDGLRLPGGPGTTGVASPLLLEEQLSTESFENLCCLNTDPGLEQPSSYGGYWRLPQPR